MIWSVIGLGFLTEARYPVVFLSNVVSTGLFLGLLVLGGRALEVRGIEGALFITFIMLAAMQAPPRALEDNSSEPEEIYLYPISPMAMLIVQAISLSARTLFNFSIVYLMLLLPMGLPWNTLAELWQYAPVAFLAGLGPGLLLGGLTLIFKRTGALANLLAILLLTGAFLPNAWMSSVGAYLPFTAVQGLMRGVAEPSAVLMVCGAFLSLGVWGYLFSERLMIRMGLSGIR